MVIRLLSHSARMMKVESFRLIQVRNQEDRSFHPKAGINVFLGDNGKGKTNLLEVLDFFSVGKSWRTGKEEDLIMNGKEEGTIMMSFSLRKVLHTIRIRFLRGYGKKIFINDNPVQRKDLIGFFKTVLFSPDELQLVKGAPEGRRRFLDMEISQVNPRYYEECLRYNRAVMQRNAAFKEALFTGSSAKVDVWDMQIASGAAYIVRKRMDSITMMNKSASSMASRLTGGKETLAMEYLQNQNDKVSCDESWFLQKLADTREEDARRCRTSVGPHRDDIRFNLNGWDLSRFGSQGQQRTAVLALKLGELEFMKQESGEYPVLLLDDVGSELDKKRRKALFQYLEHHGVQTFLTSSDFSDDDGMMNIVDL